MTATKDATQSTGLTSDEARGRLEKFGPNAVPCPASAGNGESVRPLR
jgi:hypothetical protein